MLGSCDESFHEGLVEFCGRLLESSDFDLKLLLRNVFGVLVYIVSCTRPLLLAPVLKALSPIA